MGDRGRPQTQELFVRPPATAEMRDPLRADWNLALAELAADPAATIDFGLMSGIFENFLDVVGLPVAIIDLNGHVLASSRWQRVCADFHRAKPGTLARCVESDVSLSRDMAAGKSYAIYRCRNGLTDCATPIVVEGVHVANLFVGQFLLAPPDPDWFRDQQRQFGFEPAAYAEALAEVPIIAEHKLPAILKLMGGLAEQLARQSLAYAAVERQVAERTRELAEAHDRLRQIAARAPGVLYQFLQRADGGFCMPYASDALIDLFGLAPAAVREDAGALLALVHPDDLDALLDSVRVSAETLTPWRQEFRLRDADGAVRWIGGDSLPQRTPDGETLWHGFISDVTARKQAEEAAQRRARELAASNNDLEQFAYVASHDLRQPLRMVNSYLALIERRYADKLDDDGREFIGYARDGALQMDRLILDLLEYSRIGRDGRPAETVDLGEALDKALHHLQPVIDEAGCAVRVERRPAPVVGNRSELVRLFVNLVGNAVKYREPSRRPRVQVRWCRENGHWQVSVGDNGIGIAPEFQADIFKIFRRLHTTQQYEGTGIGLAVCQKIVEGHGGRMWVESEAGKGSSFHFTVPAAP